MKEIEAVVAEVAEGTRSAQSGAEWAWLRSSSDLDQLARIALIKLQAGWMMIGGTAVRDQQSD